MAIAKLDAVVTDRGVTITHQVSEMPVVAAPVVAISGTPVRHADTAAMSTIRRWRREASSTAKTENGHDGDGLLRYDRFSGAETAATRIVDTVAICRRRSAGPDRPVSVVTA